MTTLLHRELSRKIIGVYYDVYNGLGQAYPEYIYEQAMIHHLLVEGCIMVFPVALRATAQIQPEPLRRWMASQCVPLGILANFHSEHLEPVFMKEIS